jgi:hypothetical protein
MQADLGGFHPRNPRTSRNPRFDLVCTQAEHQDYQECYH